MNPAPLLSIVSGLLCLLLSFVFYFKSSSVQSLSADLQKQQTEIQSQQQSLQTEQQKFQNQQQVINSAVKLAQEVGPQVLNDLGLLARDNKNDKIRALLKKYDVTINDKPADAPKPTEAPKPAPTTPSAPKLQ